MKKGQSKTALASMLDKMNQIQTVDGGDVSDFKDHPLSSNTTFPFNNNKTESNIEQVISIDPTLLRNWKYNDRPEAELGDITALAQELKTIGQQQPCIVRPCNDTSVYKYEVIAGERRWRAAKEAKILLKVLVKYLNDHEAAICQAGENSQRKDLSDYAKGMNYAKLIELKILTRQELQDKLKISKSSIRNLLSFSRVSSKIWEAIGDVTKISPATAYELSRLQEKGEEYIEAIFDLIPKIRSGKIGHTKLENLTLEKIDNNARNAIEVRSLDGRHIFTWRNDTNKNRSIAFPKNVREIIDFNRLGKAIVEEIEAQFRQKKEK